MLAWVEAASRTAMAEVAVVAALSRLKPGRALYANVESYAGIVMVTAGIPRELFTPRSLRGARSAGAPTSWSRRQTTA